MEGSMARKTICAGNVEKLRSCLHFLNPPDGSSHSGIRTYVDYTRDYYLSRMSAIRSAAWPSQSAGMVPFFPRPDRISADAARMEAGSVPTR